ncbi:MAG: hypothetical protein WCF20_12645 [Methylovirgula sp.]
MLAAVVASQGRRSPELGLCCSSKVALGDFLSDIEWNLALALIGIVLFASREAGLTAASVECQKSPAFSKN